MKLVSYARGANAHQAGILVEDSVYDLARLLRGTTYGVDDATALTVRTVLDRFGDQLPELSAAVDQQLAAGSPTAVGSVDEVHLGPPVTDPAKVLCIGLNYADHVGETGRALPTHPDVFAKFASTLIGPADDIACSSVSDKLDFEGEVGVVIGRRCRRVTEEQALDHVAGLTVVNDLTARDLQYNGTQWLPGKAVDGSTPCGPALVTLDEVGDVQNLQVSTWVDGEQMQSSTTARMIFSVAAIVSYVSQFLELSPGDIIATGTPEGIGSKRTPPRWLAPGSTVEVRVQHVGSVRNTVR
ncbi:fumarylacetoacetate hydrolase family protein [Modestobacter sp. Leaf380]|uniref:fumarylacetoacetate hydrolase family protein n=1 Tax=Modestobacter sp. Leaf380 TaxID=1736356 RepID=UPI0006F2B1CD|nr:fumarylacetoacetate hydrolase family protein [Modestobacter sp. Leaf380]KQS65703.1 5-oxopent-3-ene-1,2,5-tricarboxylate decarboxylase [Modestobacter sp. Leaf380]